MSDRVHCGEPLTSCLPEPIATIVRGKDRVIRLQTERIEELEKEVTVLRKERDYLNTKLALLAGRIPVKHHAPKIAEDRTSLSHDGRNFLIDSTAMNSFSNNGAAMKHTGALSVLPHMSKGQLGESKFQRYDCPHHAITPTCYDLRRANAAALVIQHAYRRYHMHKNFTRLRSEPERSKRSVERTQIESQRTDGYSVGDAKSLKGVNNCDFDSCVPSRPKSNGLRTIDEHSAENVPDLDRQVLYPDLSDSSDNDSILDTALEPAFDESSTNFEHLLEAEETEGGDDSFNSDDSQDVEPFASRCSTLRARNADGYPHLWPLTVSYGSSEDGGHVATLRSFMSDSTYSDSDSVSGDVLSMKLTPVEDIGSHESDSFDSGSLVSQDSLSKLSVCGRNFDGFIRFRIPSYSPVWKRKSVHRGSTGSLPEASSSCMSQVSSAGSLEPNELSGSFADVSQISDEPSRCLTADAGSIADEPEQLSDALKFSTQSYRGQLETCHGFLLEIPPSRPLASHFCDTGNSVLSDRLRKRIYRVGLNLFNRKPDRGIKYLIDNRFIDLRPNAVAKFLLSRKGLSRQMIGEYLGTIHKQFNVDVLRCFAEEINLTGLQVDVALRKYQSFFRMPGEAQKIERLMEVFAHRYCACNPDHIKNFRTPDTVFLLAFAIVMLNTDQHNRCIKDERRMMINDFINNLRGIDDGHDIDHDLLMGIFERVRLCEFKPGCDHVTQVAKLEAMIIGKKTPVSLVAQHRRLVCYCRLYEVPDLSKPEKPGSHQRELFLFNDLLVVSKLVNKKKKSISYSFRQAFSLLGMAVYLFETPYYKHGVRLALAARPKDLIMLCAQSEHDRTKFVEDLKESILEMEEMEVLESYENRKEHRFQDKVAYQGTRQHSREMNRHSKDSGVVDVDNIMQNNRLSASDCDERKNSTCSSTIFDFSERNRTESRGSLDSGMMSNGSSSASSCTEPAKLGHTQSLKIQYSMASNGTPREGGVRKNKTFI